MSQSLEDTDYDFNDRRKKFMVGLNVTEARRKREEGATKLRKEKKDNIFNQRRKRVMQTGVNTLSKGSDETINQFHPQDGELNSDLVEKFKSMKEAINLKTAHCDEDQTSFHAAEMFRKYLSSEETPPIKEVITSGVVPILIKLLGMNGNPAIQYEACWALTNIASGTSEQVQHLCESGIIPELIKVLKSKHAELREQALWVLGNLAGDSLEYRNRIVDSPLIGIMIDYLRSSVKCSFIQVSAWTFSNMFRGKPQVPCDKMIMVVPILAMFLGVNDEEILADTCWAISYITDTEDSVVEAVMKTKIPVNLLKLLDHGQLAVRIPALRVVGNILTTTHQHTQTLLNDGILDPLSRLLKNERKNVAREACWAISNITAGTLEQISTFLHHSEALTLMLDHCKNDDLEIQREAIWAIANATSGGSVSHTFTLVHRGLLNILNEALDRDDTKLTLLTLEAVGNILEAGALYQRHSDEGQNLCAGQIDKIGMLTKIEDLQTHPNNEIYNKVVELIEEYYDHDVEDPGNGTQAHLTEFDV